MKIASTLHEIMLDCLFRKKEITDPNVPPAGAVIVEGITQKLRESAFNPAYTWSVQNFTS